MKRCDYPYYNDGKGKENNYAYDDDAARDVVDEAVVGPSVEDVAENVEEKYDEYEYGEEDVEEAEEAFGMDAFGFDNFDMSGNDKEIPWRY